MKIPFYYVVKIKLIRRKDGNEIDFIEVEEKFENGNPILGREQAFNYYQNYIDVLLQARDKEYVSDKQARTDLTFNDNETTSKWKLGDNVENGIGIYLVICPQSEDNNPINKFWEDGLLIHGIGKFFSPLWNFQDSIMSNLEEELDSYKKFNYETKGYEAEVIYCNQSEWEEGYRENEPYTYTILKTPFDWEGYNEPYWWGQPDGNELEEQPMPRTIEEIILGGESNTVEFKPSLLYNFSTGKAGISIKGIIAKTICGFLNSNGGLLFIGVNDDGEIQGLDFDYQLANGKKPLDFFLLEFDQMIEYFLSFSIKNNINGQLYERDGKDIFLVEVSPSKRGPVFLKGQNGKEFYVRGEASTRPLTDIEEITNYCLNKWIN